LKSIITILLAILILSPETSLNTGLAIDKNSIHSVYLYRVLGTVTVSDLMIIILFFFIFLNIIKIMRISLGVIGPILIIYLVYYFIGLLYNIFVHYELKAYLYDIKAGLYLFVPYLILKIYFRKIEITERLVFKIALLYLFGIALDSILVFINGGSHYVNQLGIPLLLEIFPLSLLIGASLLFSNKKSKLLFRSLTVFEVFSSVNRVNLGAIFSGILAVGWAFLTKLKMSFRLYLVSIFILYYFINIVVQNIIFFIPNLLSEIKADGWEVRRIEIYNFFENSIINFPIIIGKGLGTTWREVVQPTVMNVFSHGPFLGSDYNFIWHNTLGGTFYKFGLIGSFLLILYLSTVASKILVTTKNTVNQGIGLFLSFSIPAFVMMNVTGIGVLKGALLSSLILFGIDRLLESKERMVGK